MLVALKTYFAWTGSPQEAFDFNVKPAGLWLVNSLNIVRFKNTEEFKEVEYLIALMSVGVWTDSSSVL